MTLTIGRAPFGSDPGVFNFERTGPRRVLYWENSPRRVRVTFAGATVADSTRVKLLHETDLLPVYYFPEEDVDRTLLEPSDRTTTCPIKGRARYASVRVGDRRATDAVWSYPEPIEGAPPLAGYLAFRWDAMDGWYEEDERVYVHPRDPYHRVDVARSSRHVRVSIGGVILAESSRPVVLFETGLPPRFYLPEADLDAARLRPSDTTTQCPYKGTASYRSVELDAERHDDLLWSYPEPHVEAAKIAGLWCFYDERIDLDVDGQRWARPKTKFSP